MSLYKEEYGLTIEERSRREQLSETRRKSARARWDRERQQNPNARRQIGKLGAQTTYRAKYEGKVYRAWDGRMFRVLRLTT